MYYSRRYDMYGTHQVRVESEKGKRPIVTSIPDGALPVGFHLDPREIASLRLIWFMIQKTIAQTPDRQVPITKSEVESVMTKKNLRRLVDAGVVTIESLRMQNKEGVNPGNRACVLLTHDGRVYCKENFNDKIQSPVEKTGSVSTGVQP